jgi:uncharacterized membrane protein YgcG
VITAYAVDGAGNVGPKSSVTYTIDLTPPVITMIGNEQYTMVEGVFTDPGATALDAVDGDVTASIFASGPSIYGYENLQDGQTVVAGTNYAIEYLAYDSSGNTPATNTYVRYVTVTADPNAGSGGTGNGTTGSSGDGTTSGGDGGGGGGCITPAFTASAGGLLPMFGLLILGFVAVRRKD